MAGKKHRTITATKASNSNKTGGGRKMARVDPTTVPELLTNILSFATQSTLASCAVVCKPWSEVSLDHLWRDLDSVFPLLELVMDIQPLEDLDSSAPISSLQRFSNMLSGVHWSRFQVYARRVKRLSYDWSNQYRRKLAPNLDPNAIALLYLHCPSGLVLLPRLETLKWATDGSAAPIFPFLSPQLESLEVEFVDNPHSANDFFSALVGRLPNLKSFTLKTTEKELDIAGSLQRAIGTWKNLETLKIPPYYLRPAVLVAAASLPNLILLDQECTYDLSHDAAATLHELPQDAFPKLETFSFNTNPASAKRLVQKHLDLFTRLTTIHLHAMNGVNDADVLEFVCHLGAICPQLTSVSLDLSATPELRRESVTPLSVGVLEALFSCRDLGALEIGYHFPLTVDEDDVERMAVAWPKLHTLYICTKPDLSLPIPGDTGNSLSILQTFAKHHPMIRELGLFFAKDKALTFSGDLWAEFEFHCLGKIDVGTSAVPGGRLKDVGFLIASLCKLEPEIDIGVSDWYIGMWCSEWMEYQSQWQETVRNLEFGMRIKNAGRARMSGIAN